MISENTQPKELIKVNYKCPIDVTNLFTDEMVRYTLNHVFSVFIEKSNEAAQNKTEYLEPVVYIEKYSLVNVDYSFLIDRLSELVSNELQFKMDFKLNFKDTKYSEYLVESILENYLEIVKINKKRMSCVGKTEIVYHPSFMKPIIIKYPDFNDNSERFIQMNAVCFKIGELQKLLDAGVFRDLKYVTEVSKFEQIDGVFGRDSCSRFWKTLNKTSVFYVDTKEA
ncbi:MAG: hypothetical protein EOM50_17785 [Erysipelotrichia bacterium]|nr:hypothetical protein [Erysipelotrichia bacterium]